MNDNPRNPLTWPTRYNPAESNCPTYHARDIPPMHRPRLTLADICKLLTLAVAEMPDAVSASLVISTGDETTPTVLSVKPRAAALVLPHGETESDC